MEIHNLDLHQYKCFKNQKIVLDPAKSFHILLGHNEAGKSTFFNAIFTLLFGSEKSTTLKKASTENFYIEGLLENNHGKFLKIERQQDTGRKGNSKIQAFYPQLNKDIFIEIFFLNQQKLQIGSKELLLYLKNFDHALFHSILGCQKLVSLRHEMALEAENLFKKNGIKPEINLNLEKIKALVTEKKTKSLSDGEWNRLQSSKQLVLSKLIEEKQKLAELENKKNVLTILNDIQGHLGDLSTLESQIAKSIENKTLDPESLRLVKKLMAEKNNLCLQKEQLVLELDTTNQKLAHLGPIDSDILSQKLLIAELLEQEEQYLLELDSLKNFELNLHTKEKERANLCQNTLVHTLSVSDSHRCMSVKAKLQNLLISYKMLKKDYEQTKVALSEVKQQLAKQTTVVGEQQLAEYLLSCQNFLAELKQNITLEVELADFKQKFQTKLNQLQLHFNINESQIAVVNREKFSEYKQTISELKKQIDDTQKQLEELKFYQATIKEKLGKEQELLLSTLQYYRDIKADRKKLGLDLQSKWQNYSADDRHQLFMKYHHMIGDEDLREENLFQKLDLIVEVKKNEQLYQEIKIKIEEIEKQENDLIHQLNQQLGNVLNLLHITDTTQTLGLEKSMELLNEVLLTYEQLKQIQNPLDRLKKRICTLLRCTEDPILVQDLICLLQIQITENEASLKQQREAQSIRVFLEQSKVNLEQKLEKLNHSIIQEQFNLDQMLSDLKLKLPLDELESSLSMLEQYLSITHNMALLKSQNERSAQFVKSFTNSWENLRKVISIQDLDQLKEYHLKALNQEQNKLEHENLNYLIANKKKSLSEINQKMDFLDQQLKPFIVDYSMPMTQLIEDSELKYSLMEKQKQLQLLLSLKCHPHDLSFYQKLLKNFDNSHHLKAAIEQTDENIHHFQLQIEGLQRTLVETELEEQKHKDLSCKIEIDHKLQQEIFDFETNMDHYLVVKSAQFLIDHMIWQYQQTYQQDLLLLASGYLNELTNGAYIQILLNLGSNKESYLSCLSVNQVFFTVDQLSEGTRDQLYLSLKLALIELFLKQNESFPLLLDDILVNFDDVRAVNALKVIEKLSSKMQIIFLTHHPHLVKLIEQNCNPDRFEVLSLDKVKALKN